MKKCVHIFVPPPFFPQRAHTLILFCSFLLAIHLGDHTTSVSNCFLILFFFLFSLSNCMHDDQGERVFVAITVLQDQWWLRTQRHVTDPWTHTVVLQSRSPTCFWWAYKPEWPLWKTVCQSPQRLNIHFSYDPALSSLGVYPREMKTSGHTRTHTRMHTHTRTHTTCMCMSLATLS